MNVVTPIRDGAPSLLDIPNQLRALADRIEKGEEAHPYTYAMLVGVNRTERMFQWTRYGWGRLPNNTELVGLFARLADAQMRDEGDS